MCKTTMDSNKIRESGFTKNLNKYVEFASWINWNPDLFLDLIKPKKGGINLNSDQRIFLRCALRFFSIYGCFPRGWGKTFEEVLALVIIAIRFPNIELAITAQTKENAADLLSDKINEILRYYPILENELLKKPKLQRGIAEVVFKNNSCINNLANAQSSKGQRRKRINIEESVLIDNATFEDALKPIVEVPRYTCGQYSVINPEELNQQINFFTTPGWKNSDEYVRNLQMIRNMIDLKGEMVLGSDWMLGCWYGRGSTKSQILQKKKTMSSIAFDQNYGGRWTGTSTGALVNINKLINCRNLTSPLFETSGKEDEFYFGIDVARSQNTNNNQSSLVIGKVNRNKETNKIKTIDIINLINISNALNFSAQAIMIKKQYLLYKPKMVIVDGNGLGVGLVDELLKESFDPITKESLGCWDTINTDNKPELSYADKCLFDLKAQSYQTKIITSFIDAIDSGRIRLLEKRQDSDFDTNDRENFKSNILPFVQTDLLFDEVGNLKLKELGGGKLSVEKIVSKLNKDRFSALAYMIFYINEFESHIISVSDEKDNISYLKNLARAPQIRGWSLSNKR